MQALTGDAGILCEGMVLPQLGGVANEGVWLVGTLDCLQLCRSILGGEPEEQRHQSEREHLLFSSVHQLLATVYVMLGSGDTVPVLTDQHHQQRGGGRGRGELASPMIVTESAVCCRPVKKVAVPLPPPQSAGGKTF